MLFIKKYKIPINFYQIKIYNKYLKTNTNMIKKPTKYINNI